MKRRFTLLIVVISLAFSSINAQNTLSLGEFDPYLTEYFRPFARGMASGMGAGWAHTAEVHSTLGFDFTLNFTIVNIPTSAAGFSGSKIASMTSPNGGGYSFSGNEFANIRSDGGPTNTITKEFETIYHPVTGAELYTPTINFDALQGINLGFAGSASIQAAIGLPKGTELMIRFMPDVSGIANSALGAMGGGTELLPTMMYGGGIKHDIKQWIPVISKVPFLQMSGLFSFSKFTTGIKSDELTLDPDRFAAGNVTDFSGEAYDDQQFEMDMSSITGSLLIGASIPVFQPFVGIGFNRGKFEAGLKGTYPILSVNDDPLTSGVMTPFIVDQNNGTESDPLVVDDIKTQFNLQAGARIKLGFFVFHYQFTKQEYITHNAGIAVTLR